VEVLIGRSDPVPMVLQPAPMSNITAERRIALNRAFLQVFNSQVLEAFEKTKLETDFIVLS